MGRKKRQLQPQPHLRRSSPVPESFDNATNIPQFILFYMRGAAIHLRPIVSALLALVLFFGLLSYSYQRFHDIFLDTLCPMPFASYLPVCRHYVHNVPDFTHFVKLQESLYDGMLSKSNADSISALELKKVELATRDLQAMIKYSNLQSHELLESKLGEYVVRTRQFGRDIQSLQAQTKGVVDNLITYNTFTFRKLSEVKSKKSSRQDLRALYEHAMSLVEKESKRLILTIIKAQGSLNLLEEGLYSMHEISVQEKFYQKSEKPNVLEDLVNMINGKGVRRSLVEENLALLASFDKERINAATQLMMMQDRMEAFQMDLEELRAQVVAPVLVPDAVPLEMHIENVGKAIERLKSGKVIDYEEKPQLDAATSTL